MRRVLASAVATACLLFPLCLYGQRRGSFHSSFSGSRGVFRGYAAAPRTRPLYRPARPVTYLPPLHTAPVQGSSLIDFGQSACLLNPTYAGSPYCRRIYPYGAAYGAEPVYPYWMPSPGYDTAEAPPPAPEVQLESQLADQVSNLAAQVEMLREEQAQRDLRGAATPPAVEPAPATTILVYRDGQQAEVQNYAIAGQTLWVFSGQTTRKVPLSDLDLAATARVNEERGVDFSPPDPR